MELVQLALSLVKGFVFSFAGEYLPLSSMSLTCLMVMRGFRQRF
jgi:hypothetical protein